MHKPVKLLPLTLLASAALLASACDPGENDGESPGESPTPAATVAGTDPGDGAVFEPEDVVYADDFASTADALAALRDRTDTPVVEPAYVPDGFAFDWGAIEIRTVLDAAPAPDRVELRYEASDTGTESGIIMQVLPGGAAGESDAPNVDGVDLPDCVTLTDGSTGDNETDVPSFVLQDSDITVWLIPVGENAPADDELVQMLASVVE